MIERAYVYPPDAVTADVKHTRRPADNLFSGLVTHLDSQRAKRFCETGPLGLASAEPQPATAIRISSQNSDQGEAIEARTIALPSACAGGNTSRTPPSAEGQSAANLSQRMQPRQQVVVQNPQYHQAPEPNALTRRPLSTRPARTFASPAPAPVAQQASAIRVQLRSDGPALAVLLQAPVGLFWNIEALAADVEALLAARGHKGALFVNGRRITDQGERFDV